MRLKETPELTLEVLCAHHRVERFDCGDDIWNVELVGLLGQVNDGPDTLTFVLRDDELFVRAYMMIQETVLTPHDATIEMRVRNPWFVVPAVGVSKEYQGSDALNRLIDRGLDVADTRRFKEPRRYSGIACITYTNEVLKRYLRRKGFREDPLYPFFVVVRYDMSD